MVLFYYLIPILSVFVLISLAAACWLMYGCCTRRPKYRCAQDKDWDDVEGFKALKYDDCTSQALIYDDKADCNPQPSSDPDRQSLLDHAFKWPSVTELPRSITVSNHNTDLSREITRQRERLTKHRESMASLPAGMLYSPPSVAVSMFSYDVAS